MDRCRRDTVLDRTDGTGILKALTKVNKIAGPPGTGKTTELLNIVEKLLSNGTRPEEIVYTTFTRAGSYEARDRAIQRFGYTEDEFPYFRTLHSLCYRLLGGGPVMQQRDWFGFGKQIGQAFSFGRFNDTDFTYATKGDHLLNMWGLHRAKDIPMRDVHAVYPENHVCSYAELEHFVESCRIYKEFLGKMDYTDILERFIEEKPEIPDAKYLIVDEAQDLSILQSKVIAHIQLTATSGVWIAGDDDQCVHEWNGADANWFIDLPADLTVLNKSYRIPASVHTLATGITDKITNRLDKIYEPRDEVGITEFLFYEDLKMDKGQWLILCRNKVFFDWFEEYCVRNGWAFHSTSEKDKAFIDAAKAHRRLCDGQIITIQEARHFYEYMSRKWVKHGGKKAILDAEDDLMLDAKTLVKNYGLKDLLSPLLMLDRGSAKQLSYLQSLLTENQLLEPPRIEICTIHGSKGRECDNVAICPDMSHKTWVSYQDNPDAEHRVFYVGATRAKNRLVILSPLTTKYYEI